MLAHRGMTAGEGAAPRGALSRSSEHARHSSSLAAPHPKACHPPACPGAAWRHSAEGLLRLDAGMVGYAAFYRWRRDAAEETHNWPASNKRVS